MFFNLARNDGLFSKMICFGSGAEYHRPGLPARVSEEYFDTRVPADAYGLSKYICAKYIERSERIFNLRLFGVFGKYEAWQVRFISNACARVVHDLPIVIRKNVVFDYLYIEDLARITEWFLKAEPRWKSYNVCMGEPHALTDLASMVVVASRKQSAIHVLEEGDGPEYTADNSRLLDEIGGFEFRDMTGAIAEIYSWYEANPDAIDPSVLQFDG
jgi:GDP-L-fucose synthase